MKSRPSLDEVTKLILNRSKGCLTLIRPSDPRAQSGRIDVRLRISALWIAVLFIFSYVDLFSLYRPDFRADLENRKLSVFDVNQAFLFFVTLYIIIPSLMVYLTLVMPRHLSRIVNITAAGLYGLTIIGSAVGEWNYFILGSLIEAILLAVVVHHSWTWPGPEPTTHPRNR